MNEWFDHKKITRPLGTTGSVLCCRNWRQRYTPRALAKTRVGWRILVDPYAPPDNNNDDDESIKTDMNFHCSFYEMFSSLGVILKEILTLRKCSVLGCNT